MVTLLFCYESTSTPYFALVDPACTFTWYGPQEVTVISTSPLHLQVLIDLADFCGDGDATYQIDITET